MARGTFNKTLLKKENKPIISCRKTSARDLATSWKWLEKEAEIAPDSCFSGVEVSDKQRGKGDFFRHQLEKSELMAESSSSPRM